MISFEGYLDEYGMVSCNREPAFPAQHTENGLLFTVTAMNSLKMTDHEDMQFDFPKLFNACFINGILYRSPEPHPKPDSHDNYTACALGALLSNDRSIARKLIWSLFSHFFYMNHLFLGQYVQIPLLLFPVGFPLLKWFFFPALWILSKFQKPNNNDASGIQLQLTIMSILDILYPNWGFLSNWILKFTENFGAVFSNYYGPNHPVTKIWS